MAFPPKGISEEFVIFQSLFQRQRDGVLIDVGAHWGTSLTPYALRGWRVYAIEPDPSNREHLLRNWGVAPNVRVDDRAVSERDGEELPLFTSPISTGISTLSPFHPSHRPTTGVRTVRLDTILLEHRI